jgi:hypothetical protein
MDGDPEGEPCAVGVGVVAGEMAAADWTIGDGLATIGDDGAVLGVDLGDTDAGVSSSDSVVAGLATLAVDLWGDAVALSDTRESGPGV